MKFPTIASRLLLSSLSLNFQRHPLAWSFNPSTVATSRYSHRTMTLSSHSEALPIFTSANITERIRVESELEMKKIIALMNESSFNHKPSPLESNADVKSYTSTHNISNYLFDCDGVLYRGTDPMPSASQTIQSLINSGKQVFFVTNNAASTRMELKCKLEKVLQCPEGMLKEEMMIGSAYVASRYLRSRLLSRGQPSTEIQSTKLRVHVVGTTGLCNEIVAAGFDVSGGQDPEGTPSGMSRDELAAYTFPEMQDKGTIFEDRVDAVVVGLDNDFNYRKLCIATVILQRNPRALLVATNRDAFDLVGFDARHLPGNGALVSAIETASGRKAINVGKPSLVLAKWIMKEYGLKAAETIMVGDRLDTDIKFGNGGGMKSALVLTGCATTENIEGLLKGEDGEERRDMMPSVILTHVGLMKEG
eukprot:scaffold8841_cov152-Alexandrium_tamarense.AAC.1